MAWSFEVSTLATVTMLVAGAIFGSAWMRSLASLYFFKYAPYSDVTV